MDALTVALAQVTGRIPDRGRPLLVAVDGADGAGKTTFADRWANVLAAPGRPVVRASVDDFHHPRAHRHALGRTAETVWSRSTDLAAFRRELVDPWLAGSGASYRRRWHDLAADALVDEPASRVPAQGLLLVDGVFLQRPELAGVWDLVVWLQVPDDVRVARMAARDGGVDDVADPSQRRYLGAQRIYRSTCDPAGAADVVVDNSDWSAPVITRGSHP